MDNHGVKGTLLGFIIFLLDFGDTLPWSLEYRLFLLKYTANLSGCFVRVKNKDLLIPVVWENSSFLYQSPGFQIK